MSIKFYNDNTEFLDDEIIEETNVLFEDVEEVAKEDLKDTEKTEDIQETDIVTDDLTIKEDEIEFIDDEPKFNREITITRSLENKFIQYTDDQFKNNN